MIRVKCSCGRWFGKDDRENSFAVISACPYCSKSWRRTKVSKIKWSVYPKYKKLVESYLSRKNL